MEAKVTIIDVAGSGPTAMVTCFTDPPQFLGEITTASREAGKTAAVRTSRSQRGAQP
jgi:hypothetical protein